jgi:RHS repeat-associated protein
MVKMDAGTANEANYFYDSKNLRVKRVVGTGANAITTNYVWEGSVVIAEYSNSVPSGGRRYYHSDRLSTRLITDGTAGAVLGTQDHLPFGEDAGTNGSSEKHRFTNYERDVESGTDYAINRQHHFATARLAQPDRVAGGAGNPQSVNRYAYSLNDPINMSDPSGLVPRSLFGPYVLDASYGNWGLYIDGVAVMQGQESIFFSMLSNGSAVVAPFGARASLGSNGKTYRTETRYRSYKNLYPSGGDVVRLGVTDVAYEVQVEVSAEQQLVWDIAFEASELLKKPACAALLSSDPLNSAIANHITPSNVLKFYQTMSEKGWLKATSNQSDLPSKTTVAKTTGVGYGAYTVFGPSFFKGTIGNITTVHGISMRRAQILTALHELGHATGAAASDHYDAPENPTRKQLERQSRETIAYHNKIIRACF